MTPVEILVTVVLAAGGLFCITGAVGLLRFPDVYARMHAAGVTDTMGTGLIVTGLLIWVAAGNDGWFWALAAGDGAGVKAGLLLSFKLVSIVFFMWVSGTTAAHAVAKAAWLDGLEPWQAGDGEGESSKR